MKKPIIVTKLKVTQFIAIKTLAESVYENIHTNPNFTSPPTNHGCVQSISGQPERCP